MWFFNTRFRDENNNLVLADHVKENEAKWVYFHGGEGRFVTVEYNTDEVVCETELMLGYQSFNRAVDEAKKLIMETM